MPELSQENPILKVGPTSAGQVLYFFGARHANDPADQQFVRLQELWNEFLNIAKGERIIFTEAAIGEVPPVYEDAIKKRGEVGATQWLAKNSGIPAFCPEPSDIEQRKALCSSFDPHVVAYALIAQNLAAWFRQTTHQSDFNEAIERSAKREAKFADIYGFTPDAGAFHAQHNKLFGDQALEDKHFLDKISDPRRGDTLVNAIVSERTKMRNEYVHGRITEAWESGKSIFIVYGKGHLAVLEPILKNFNS